MISLKFGEKNPKGDILSLSIHMHAYILYKHSILVEFAYLRKCKHI